MITAIPDIGTTVTHVASGQSGIVGKIDIRDRAALADRRPHVRIDYGDGLYSWVPAVECSWPGKLGAK